MVSLCSICLTTVIVCAVFKLETADLFPFTKNL